MPLFNDKTAIRARAILLGERLDLKPLRNAEQLAAQPLTLPTADHGCVVLFRYGVAVLFDVPPLEEVKFVEHMRPFLADPLPEPEIETLDLQIAPEARDGFERGQLYIQDAGLDRLHIIADVLAKSVVLAEYERRVAGTFDRIEPLAARLQASGRVGFRAGELIRHTGGNLLVLHRMVGRVEVGEKPDALWERPDLERLYLRLEDEFELRERQSALHRKLEVIGQTVETVLDLLQTRRSLRVEWYIVLLIVAEIALSLYALFWHR
jgi:uncharacterized Rmd1/YagE family protein